MTEAKKILLIGRSGRGKSTLANVLLNRDGGFREFFKESGGSISQTRNIQSESFKYQFIEQEEEKEITYQVIDTPGIGDTKLGNNEILDIISEAVYLVRGGVSRVLFVTDGRFDEHETDAYNLLRKTIFDNEIAKHTTIVRTKFRAFRNAEECQKDIEEIKKSSDELKEIIESCQDNIRHVDNPSTEIKGVSEEEARLEIEINKNRRSQSKKILLDHLRIICQKSDTYNPPNLKDLIAKISERMEKKRELSESLNKLKKQLKRVEGKIKDEELAQVIKDLKEEIDKESEAIRRAILEHVRSKLENSDEVRHFSENQKELSISKKKQWKSKIKSFLSEVLAQLLVPVVRVEAKGEVWKIPFSNKESISNITTSKPEENVKLSNEISKAVTNLTKEERWIEKSELIKITADWIREVVDEYQNVRNILIIGHGNSGRSTLSELLLNKVESSSGEIFKESYRDNKNREFKSEILEIGEVWYRVVVNDIFGANDNNTDLPDEEIIQKIVKVIFEVRRGINQVFFVFKDEFSREQIKILKIFKDFVFEDSNATKFATLIRTNFERFNDPQACEKDKETLFSQNEELKEIINSCNDVIHINNPPIREREKIREDEKNRKERQQSRIIINHLVENCSEIYKLKEEVGGVKFDIKADLPMVGTLEMGYIRNSYYGKTYRIAASWLFTSIECKWSSNVEGKKMEVAVGSLSFSLEHDSNKEEKALKSTIGVGNRELLITAIKSEEVKKLSGRLKLTKKEDKSKKKEKNIKRKEIELQQIKQDWTNINSNFTPELVQEWTDHGFTYEQVREWISAGLNATDIEFCVWLRDIKHHTPEQVLNHGNLKQLSQEFFNWRQEQQQAQVEQPPK